MRGRISIKLKLTLWVTAFMVLTAAVCLGLILAVSGQVSRREAENLLTVTVREQIGGVHLSDGQLSLDQYLSFYKNGVYFLLYNTNRAMRSGQTPPGFPVGTP